MAERDKLSKDEYKKIMSRPENKGKDPWTIHDVLNAVKLQHTKDPFSGKKAKDWAHNPFEEAMHSVDLAMEEKNPLAGGTFEGSQYFSNLRPQGKGDEKFSVEAQNIIDNAFRANRTKKDVLKAQEYLAEIEYIHPSEIDGKFGKQTRKALNRLQTNMNKDPEALYHSMRDINIFKRDK